MSSDLAISVSGLGKRYRIGKRERYRTLRDTLTETLTAPFRRIRAALSGAADRTTENTIWAVRDVSFEIKSGEVVGVIGRNGAGKSTLLKVLSRITEPTEGRADLYGRIGSLLEVGTGFHPELTGRENVYLNGAILGMRRPEIAGKFDEIVAFAELDRFIDTPVKHYSSGMYMRLAFAVAAHLEPEILLVDEVLAVGDVAFQKKCLGKMQHVAKQGRTVMFVSHNMGAVRSLCNRAIWIDRGRIRCDGDQDTAICRYLEGVYDEGFEGIERGANSEYPVDIRRVVLRRANGDSTTEFAPGDSVRIEISYQTRRRIESPYFWIGIVSQYGPLLGASMLFDGNTPDHIEGDGMISCTLKSLPLVPQSYTIRMGVRAKDGSTLLAPTQEAAFFNVIGRMRDYGFKGEAADALSWESAPVILPYEWELPDGRIITIEGFRANGRSG